MRTVKIENPLYRIRKSLLDCGIEILVPAKGAYQVKCWQKWSWGVGPLWWGSCCCNWSRVWGSVGSSWVSIQTETVPTQLTVFLVGNLEHAVCPLAALSSAFYLQEGREGEYPLPQVRHLWLRVSCTSLTSVFQMHSECACVNAWAWVYNICGTALPPPPPAYWKSQSDGVRLLEKILS